MMERVLYSPSTFFCFILKSPKPGKSNFFELTVTSWLPEIKKTSPYILLVIPKNVKNYAKKMLVKPHTKNPKKLWRERVMKKNIFLFFRFILGYGCIAHGVRISKLNPGGKLYISTLEIILSDLCTFMYVLFLIASERSFHSRTLAPLGLLEERLSRPLSPLSPLPPPSNKFFLEKSSTLYLKKSYQDVLDQLV